MKRKSLRRALSAALALVFLLALSGCGEENAPRADRTVPPLPSYTPPETYPAYTGQWEDTDEPLTIYVENLPLNGKSYQEKVREALENRLGKNVKLKWVCPQTASGAEQALEQLRIEVAAGGGPDVFLVTSSVLPLSGYNLASTEEPVSLFPNPEKTMRSGIFLPLDGLLESPSFMDPELMNQTILSAGRTSEGQMVLPISYTYDVAGMAEGVLPEGAQVPASRAELLSLESEASIQVINQLAPFTSLAPARMLGPLADYDREELLFTQEELFHWALEYNNAYRTVWDMHLRRDGSNVYAGGVHRMEVRNTRWRGKGQADSLIFPLYNVYGGLTAEVTAFAAINKNTKKANNAMYFLDLLLQPELPQNADASHKVEGLSYSPRAPFYALMSENGISIIKEAFVDGCSQKDVTRLQALEAEHVNAVQFCSQMDEVLYDMFEQQLSGPPKTEQDISDAVSAVYSKLQMILQE